MHRIQHIGLPRPIVSQQAVDLGTQVQLDLLVVLEVEQLKAREAHADGGGPRLGHFGYFCRPQKWVCARGCGAGFSTENPEAYLERQPRPLMAEDNNTGANLDQLTGKTEQFIENNSRNLIIAIGAGRPHVAIVGYGKFIVEPARRRPTSTCGAPSSTS